MSVAGDTVAPVLNENNVTVTSATGAKASLAVNVPVPPSFTVRLVTLVMIDCRSMTVTGTATVAMPIALSKMLVLSSTKLCQLI